MKKPAGPNISNLGLGVGSIKSSTGVGAIYTNFKSSAGGAGQAQGTELKAVGLGGLANAQSLDIGGSGEVANSFGGGGALTGGSLSRTSLQWVELQLMFELQTLLFRQA